MKNIFKILDVIQNKNGAKLRQILEISRGYFALTGKFSLTNLGRWTTGTSVRSLERFYASPQAWLEQTLTLISVFFGKILESSLLFRSGWCLAIDETVGKKTGKKTHGLGYHYSSKEDKVIKSISVLSLSLIHIKTRLSLPVHQGQLEHTTVGAKSSLDWGSKRKKEQKSVDKPAKASNGSGSLSEATSEATVQPLAKKRGRPKGSKNKPKPVDPLTDMAYTFQVLKTLLVAFLSTFKKLLGNFMEFTYIVGDSGFGNNTVANICIEEGKHLISKLQYNAALYFSYVAPPLQAGERKGRGKPRKYGEKLDYNDITSLDAHYLVAKQVQKDGSVWHIYQFKNMLSKNFDMPLNIVVIIKYNKKGNLCKATNRIILFCTNNKEDYQNMMDIYQVRFQIEFNFRDARQYFGLSHFKNIKQQQVKNVIGFSFFMVTLSNIIIAYFKQQDPKGKLSIQDLKACFRAQKYLLEFKNMPTLEQGDIFNPDFYAQTPILGAINF